jgi:hypothetical protein
VAFTQLSLGLTLTIPTNGTRNWGTTLKNTSWTKISGHDHSGAGNGVQLSAGAIQAGAITSSKLANNIALKQYASLLAPVGTTQTVDLDNGNTQKLSLASASGNVTVTITNPQTGGLYRLFVIQGATARQIVWPASVKWPQAQAPILSTANGSIDIVELYYDGTNYFADWQVDFL